MQANWYAAIRKRHTPAGPWVLLFGPYATKRDADAMHLKALNLLDDLYPQETLRMPVHATIKVSAEISKPGMFNGK